MNNGKDKIVGNEVKLVERFDTYFTNTVEKSTAKTPTSLRDSSNQQSNTDNNVKKIISEYKNHSSVVKIKGTYKHFGNFNVPKASPKDINRIMKSLNSKKSTGLDKIPPKLVKLAANIIDCHICNILNQSISSSMFTEQAKIANVRPIYKNGKREEIKNYRSVSVLSSFSIIYEKFIQKTITSFVDKYLSEFISAYRKACSTNHVLLRLIEQWESELDNKNFVGS